MVCNQLHPFSRRQRVGSLRTGPLDWTARTAICGSGLLVGIAASSALFLPVLRLRNPTRRFMEVSITGYTVASVSAAILVAAAFAIIAVTVPPVWQPFYLKDSALRAKAGTRQRQILAADFRGASLSTGCPIRAPPASVLRQAHSIIVPRRLDCDKKPVSRPGCGVRATPAVLLLARLRDPPHARAAVC